MPTESNLPAQFKFITLNIHGGLDKKLATIKQWQRDEHISAIALTETGAAPTTVEPQLFVAPNINPGSHTRAGCAILLAPWLAPGKLIYKADNGAFIAISVVIDNITVRLVAAYAPSNPINYPAVTRKYWQHALTYIKPLTDGPLMVGMDANYAADLSDTIHPDLWVDTERHIPAIAEFWRQTGLYDVFKTSRPGTLAPPTSNPLPKNQPSGRMAIIRKKPPT